MTTRNRRSQMRSEALKRIAWHPSAGDSAAHAPLALDIQTVQRTRAATPGSKPLAEDSLGPSVVLIGDDGRKSYSSVLEHSGKRSVRQRGAGRDGP